MIRTPTVLILAANRSNVPSIRALKRAGFRVVVADGTPAAAGLAAADIDWPIDPADLPALRHAIRGLDALDGIMTLAEVGVRPAARLARELGLPGLSVEAAENATSKAAMRRLWRPLGEHSLPFALIEDPHEAARAARLIHTWPLIVKPDRSFGGSRGVRRVDAPDQLEPAVREALAAGLPGSGAVIEPLVEGREFSCELFVDRGQTHLLAVGEKVKSPPPWRVDLAVRYPAALSRAQINLLRRVAARAVELLGIDRGPVHLEFVWSRAGLTLIEAGARCGGGLTPVLVAAATGIDEVVEAARVACGQTPRNLRPRLARAAEYRFLILPPGRIVETHIPAWRDGGQPPPAVTQEHGGQPPSAGRQCEETVASDLRVLRDHPRATKASGTEARRYRKTMGDSRPRLSWGPAPGCHAIVDVALTVRPGEVIEPLRCASQRAGHIGVVADPPAEATRLADALSREIRVRYDDGRVVSPTIDPAAPEHEHEPALHAV